MKHLTSIHDLTETNILSLFELASSLKKTPALKIKLSLNHKIIAVMFFQPSTRTRLGFEVATLRMGGNIIGFADPSVTRLTDYIGESFLDSVQVIAQMSDCIIIRHFKIGAAKQAADVSPVSIINAGDGANEHPVQALSDLWLIHEHLGGVRGAAIGIAGNPGFRVLRSLIYALIKAKVGKLLFLLPLDVKLSDEIRAELVSSRIKYDFCASIDELLSVADAIEIMPLEIPDLNADPKTLRPQNFQTPEWFRLTKSKIQRTHSRTLILHPGPRRDELDLDTDGLPNSLYFTQVKESLYMRMAVLHQLLC